MSHILPLSWRVALAMLVLVNLAQAQTSLQGWWSNPAIISDPAIESAAAAVAALPGGNCYLAWSAYTSAEGYRVFGREAGGSFSSLPQAAALSSASIDQINPVCATAGSYVYASWIERSPYNQGRIMFARRTGGDWSTAQPLSEFTGRTTSVAIAAAGAEVYLVWSDARTGTPNLFAVASANNGTSWSAVRTITSTAYSNAYPSLAISAAGLHLVWEDWKDGCGEIAFSQSTDQALTWSAPVRLSFVDTFASERPSLAVGPDTLHVAWQEEGTAGRYAVHLNTRAASGSWSGQRLTATNLDARMPRVSRMGSNIWVSYLSPSATTDADVPYLLASTNAGQTWLAPAALAASPQAGGNVGLLAVDGAQAYLGWVDYGLGLPRLRVTLNPPPSSAVAAEQWIPLD